MPGADPFAGISHRPASVGDWEELLVRLEITPRALRNAIEDATPGDPAVREQITLAVVHETLCLDRLERLREGRSIVADAGGVIPPGEQDTPALLEAFARLRGRTFATVQRRGLEVWDWTSPLIPDGTLTVYPLLRALSAHDGRILAEVRAAGRSPTGVC